MTIYRVRRGLFRPTLRLRLTLLNAGLLVLIGMVLIGLAWLLWKDASTLIVYGLLTLLLISVVGVVGAWMLAGRALRPLHRVTATAQRLGEKNLDERIRYSGADDEVAGLDRKSTRLNSSHVKSSYA